jgi:hypothetical protein
MAYKNQKSNKRHQREINKNHISHKHRIKKERRTNKHFPKESSEDMYRRIGKELGIL